jgi:ATP-binding cassette subfamily C protein CydC
LAARPTPSSSSVSWSIGGQADPVLVFCLLYIVLAVGTGVFEWTQRVWMARMASLTAHDLRAAAVAAASRGPARTSAGRADLITRIIGDSARVKADLKGILVHLTQNSLLLLAITILFLYLAPRLGLLFLLSGLLAILIGYFTVEEVAETTSQQRRKESKYAAAIELPAHEGGAWSGTSLNRSSAKKEVRITKIIGRSTLLIHAAVAATLGLAFWIGVQDVRGGALAPGELFLFIAYAITIQRRAVMSGRQVARGGKVLANAERIGHLIETGAGPAVPARSLVTSIELKELRIKSSAAHGKQPQLGPLDLVIPRGEHLLVLGNDGAGKTSLLRILSGREQAKPGQVLWDGDDVGGSPEILRESVAYLPDDVEFGGMTVRWLIGLAGTGEPNFQEVQMLQDLGAWKIIRGLRGGLEQVVASSELSRRERRTLALVGILMSDAPVWLLDEPVDGDGHRDTRRIGVTLDRATDRTVIVGLRRPVLVERFDRIVVLRKGQIDFQGSPAEWKLRRDQIREIRGG